MCGIDGTETPKYSTVRYAIAVWGDNPTQDYRWVTATGESKHFHNAKMYVNRGLGSKLANLKKQGKKFTVKIVSCEVW